MKRRFKIEIFAVAFLATVFFLLRFGFALSVRAEPLFRTRKSLEITAMGKVYKFYYPEIDVYGGKYYLKRSKEVVDGIFRDTLVRPVDASYSVDPTAEDAFAYESERYGKGIDCDELARDITLSLNGGDGRVSAKVKTLSPSLTLDELKANTRLIASFSTYYGSSGEGRKNNVALAAKYIGVATVGVGEEFSFNRAVGARTTERGFSSATVIQNGKFVDGVGGGVCQVSSTVYACALSAGMTVTERRNHSLLVSYTLPSLDAMVSSASDLKFINERQRTVYLVVDADGERVRARIYGKDDGSEYEISSEVSEYVEPPETSTIETYDLPKGKYVVTVTPKRGAISTAYISKIVDGETLWRKRLTCDVYSPLAGVILVGKANS